MKITFTSREPDIQIIRFEGDLDYHASAEIRKQLAEYLASSPQKTLVDLGRVPYIDSSGIATFVELSQKSKAYGGRIIFCNPTDAVKSIFELAKLHLFFTLAGSEDEASQLLS